MSTPRIHSLVSLAAALTVTLTLVGCASAPSRGASEGPISTDAAAPAVRFDNSARDYVHVYLVGQKREWLLGRVEPGGRATLRIPDAAMVESPGSIRLAVLAGQRATLRVAGEARAAFTLAQPATEILSQRWTFSQPLTSGQLTGLRLGSARTEIGQQ
ncbi:MAG: hypothetical protein JWL95_1526 [Gemmatimonadetes bacterium]|nr:hypothetical protein [Gemmatimonadota bacterium]